MFVKATKAKGYTYINIVESYRDETGVSRHKILYNFGRLDELKADEIMTTGTGQPLDMPGTLVGLYRFFSGSLRRSLNADESVYIRKNI